jgi:hypothetical protein
MNSIIKFINDMKEQYNMNDATVLQAIQQDPQHDFIMNTQDVDIDEAADIICEAEDYLLNCIGEGF